MELHPLIQAAPCSWCLSLHVLGSSSFVFSSLSPSSTWEENTTVTVAPQSHTLRWAGLEEWVGDREGGRERKREGGRGREGEGGDSEWGRGFRRPVGWACPHRLPSGPVLRDLGDLLGEGWGLSPGPYRPLFFPSFLLSISLLPPSSTSSSVLLGKFRSPRWLLLSWTGCCWCLCQANLQLIM